MIIDDIFSSISAHMVKGLMVHEQLANYYDFIGLEKYGKDHEKHYISESKSYRKLNKFYISHHNRLIKETKIENPNVIPAGWYGYSRLDVDTQTKKKALKSGVETWIEWERSTVDLYSDMYRELLELNEVVAAEFVKTLILDAQTEHSNATQLKICLESVDYDLEYVLNKED